MDFIIFGLGAIGTYIGGSLAHSGQNVVFIERAEAIRDNPVRQLRLEIQGQTIQMENPHLVSSLGEALDGKGPFVAIVAVKAFDTAALAAQMAPFTESLAGVVSLQNGVENETTLARSIGQDKVIAGTLTSAVGRSGLGNVTLERLRGIGLAGDNPLVTPLLGAFEKAGLRPAYFGDPQAMKWSKMLTNLLMNATSAILDMTPAEIMDTPGVYRLEVEQIREAARVMHALGYAVVDLPGTPVKALTFAIERLPQWLSQTVLKNGVVKGRGGKMPSFHIDLSQGRRQLEVGYLNGAVVRAGQISGVATPVNRLLTDTLEKIASGELSWQIYKHNPDKLVQDYLQSI